MIKKYVLLKICDLKDMIVFVIIIICNCRSIAIFSDSLFFTTELFFFSQRLKKLVPRQVDVNFETLVEKYQTKQRQQEEMAFKAKYVYVFLLICV